MRSKIQRTMQVLTVIGVAAGVWKITGAPWFFM
jgi:hypothetical protein